MIRSNLVALLILAATVWAINGFVEAAAPVAPERARTMETVQDLLRIVKPDLAQSLESSRLAPRKTIEKPSMIYWPENVQDTEDVRLIVKFHDRYKVRLDSDNKIRSAAGEDIESLSMMLEDLNVTLMPAFSASETEIDSLIQRAERHSGRMQPDLSGIYFVVGSQANLEIAGMTLLHDLRVETAVFDKREDPRKAIAARKQAPKLDMETVADASNTWQPDDALASAYNTPKQKLYDRSGRLIDPELNRADANVFSADHFSRDKNGGLPGAPRVFGINGSCCVGVDEASEPNGMFGLALSPDNPIVQNFCLDQQNATTCLELNGVFYKGGTCDPSAVNATLFMVDCSAQSPPGFDPNPPVVGSCCVAGDVEIVTRAECGQAEGFWMHGLISRFSGYGTQYPNIDVTATPIFNLGIQPQLLAHAYGLTNFIWTNITPFGPVFTPGSGFNSNYSYWGLGGMGPANPLDGTQPWGTAAATIPFESGNGDFFNTSGNYNNNAFFAGNPGSYRMGLIDFQTRNAAGVPTGVVSTVDGNPLSPITGGFTFGSSNATGIVLYNPNLILATDDSRLCEFGVCAVDCWDDADDNPTGSAICETASASVTNLQQLSPILGPNLIAPRATINTLAGPIEVGNVRCSSWIYEVACSGNPASGMALRSGRNTFNPAGSLWQNIIGSGNPGNPLTWTPTPSPIILTGCITQVEDAENDVTWWKDYASIGDALCCFDDNIGQAGTCAYELIEVEAEASSLKGLCTFSNANYPTMFINQAGPDQVLGALGCFGQLNPCPVYCNDEETSDDVCAIAPICCDTTKCDSVYSEYAGWSFLCADIQNQRNPNVPIYTLIGNVPVPSNLQSRLLTDFDQNLKPGGPYPQFNPLSLTTPVLRNPDGTVEDINPAAPGIQPLVLSSPNSCRIAYGVQNQCYTSYFSEYQPSLGLAAGNVLPAIPDQLSVLNGGCSDFECCHRVCSINSNATTFDYQTCCTEAWTEECVDKAIEICYQNQGGVTSTQTPDFTPLQFNLSQKTGRGPRPMTSDEYLSGLRRLAPAPQQAPSVISPTVDAVQPADNWLQSLNSAQWILNANGNNQSSFALPSVLGPRGVPGIGLQFGIDANGNLVPALDGLDNPTDWDQFYYGEPASQPIAWWENQGLSLYGNTEGQGWPQDPSLLSYSYGLYSWGEYISQNRAGFHPWGPFVNGTSGAGLNIAVIDTSAWLQEYVNASGQLVGAVHEDLGNVLLEGPVIGAAPVEMLFDPIVNQPQRATAVLGTIAASVNGIGIDGIAPDALTFFYPTQSVTEGDREQNAWLNALIRLSPGDILLATYPGGNPGGGDTDFILADRGATLTALGVLEIARNLGVTVVFPLGDNGQDLTGTYETDLLDNMLLAGATLPSRSPRRFWSSNYIGTGVGPGNVLCSMVPIVSTGGDCNLTRTAIFTPDSAGFPSGYISREMQQRSYTNNFGNTFDGSKAAAAQVAAVAACVQGLSLQYYGAPQTGDSLTQLLFNTKRIAGGLSAPPNEAAFTVTPFGIPGAAVSGWMYGVDENVAPAYVGGYLSPSRAGVELTSNADYAVEPTTQSTLLAFFIRGWQLLGDASGLEINNDLRFFSAFSELTNPGEGPNVNEQDDNPPGPLPPTQDFDFGGGGFEGGIRYAGGYWTDLFVTGLERNQNFINSRGVIALDVAFQITPRNVYLQMEQDIDENLDPQSQLTQGNIYNFLTEEWERLARVVATTNSETQTIDITYKSEIVRRDFYFGRGGEFYVRSGAVSPFDETQANEFVIYYDFLTLRGDGVLPGP